ncbi:MAG TPA: hypothetical protein VEB21_06745 [Terriglobales bacterium]|nr:hypothetical protein [Terriglobales bacterium]
MRIVLRNGLFASAVALSLACGAPRAEALVCAGDCDVSNSVTVDEILTLITSALAGSAPEGCAVADVDGNGQVTVDEILSAVSYGLAGCPPEDETDLVWRPSVSLPSLPEANARGLLDRRGLIHTHSYFSHDACDNMPVKDGVRDEVCFGDLRRGICQTRHDYIMFTDHPSDFRFAEFPDTLMYRADRGDELVERNDRPVASWSGCPDSEQRTLIMAGSESGNVMPVGLEQHVAATPEEREAVYGSASDEAAQILRANGAVVLLAHTEDRSVEELLSRDIDGFEMYNIHANLLLPQATGMAVRLLFRLDQKDPGLAHPDLALLYLISEDPRYLSRWGSVLAAGKHIVTTQGTDAHRNTLPVLMQDGERVDSFRRLMLWFSNHLLIRPEQDGSWDDRHLKEALKQGRLYGAFEILGYPRGFDYHASAGEQIAEMGDEIALSSNPTLKVAAPEVRGLDRSAPAPELEVRLLRAIEGGFEEVASGPADIEFTPTVAGAYRAEVRMVPHHLRDFMSTDAASLLGHDYVWIYSNAIYVR